MRLRVFNAPDMKQAMQLIRREMGEDAIIVSTARADQGKGITVTAASETLQAGAPLPGHHSLTPHPLHRPASISPTLALQPIEEVLRFHAVPDDVRQRMMETATHLCLQGNDLTVDLTRLLAACFQYAPLPLDQKSYLLMLVGAPGTGKTMTIAKMASQAVMEKRKPVIITTDNKRAGGVEQLSAFTTILGIELQIADHRGELWRILKECSPEQPVLIDTGGVNPYHNGDLRELGEYIALDRRIEPVLVAAAGSDCAEADDAVRAFAPLGIRRMLVTRIDAARRYGSILTAAYHGRLALTHASNSSQIIGEFVHFDPVTFAELLLRFRRKEPT